MSSEGKLLITFAWTIEIVGVTAGMANSAYTTFGNNLPSTFVEYIPAVPMIALAVAELGRVPLASAIFRKRKVMQAVAFLGIVALGYLAVENWAFGFERIVDLRLRTVNAANSELSHARAEGTVLIERRKRTEETDHSKRDELRRGLDQRDESIASLTAQQNKEAEVHQKKLEGILEACRVIRERCIVPRSQLEDARYAVEVKRVSDELALRREERTQLLSQIDGLVSKDRGEIAQLDHQIGLAKTAEVEAQKSVRSAFEGNQIYRLAASFYGVGTADVTQEQFARARLVFSMFSALAVALAGTIAALVYYSGNRLPNAPSLIGRLISKVARARRAYYARMRKPLKVDVPGPERVVYRDGKETIEKIKEVVRWIDRIVLIPRWGIKFPFYVNSLVNQRGGDDSTDSASKVTQLKKAN